MGKANASLAAHRERLRGQGLVRVEVNVRREDTGLVRAVAAALTDPARQADARRMLVQGFAAPEAVSLKALLAAAPLDGITLDRSADTGRDIDL